MTGKTYHHGIWRLELGPFEIALAQKRLIDALTVLGVGLLSETIR